MRVGRRVELAVDAPDDTAARNRGAAGHGAVRNPLIESFVVEAGDGQPGRGRGRRMRVGDGRVPGLQLRPGCAQPRPVGAESFPIWHESSDLRGADWSSCPGVRLRRLPPGRGARAVQPRDGRCPSRGAGRVLLGICNGFQVLAEAGLVPGALLRNASLRFCAAG